MVRPIRFGWQALVLLGLTPGLGCLVSFDGYSAAENAEAGGGGDSATGGDGANGGGARGGSSGGGTSGASTGGKGGKGGASSGGDTATGGDDTGGSPTGGSSTGGSSTGGASTGGASTGGSTGGSSTGGKATGGSMTGGMSGMAGSSGGASGGTAGNAGTDGMAPECPANGRGPGMIEIPRPGGGFFCIDRSEVTNGMYQAFLATSPRVADQEARCSWNMNFSPETGTACNPLPTTGTNAPVACVDWCDAKMFCEWAGKHLCGAIGGGPSPPGSFDDEATDEWYRTCTHAGDNILPYGDMYDGSYCVGIDYGVVRPVNVATVANCQGGYDGVWDMSGNVSEWTDTCSASSGAADTCAHRGGSWYDLKSGAPLYCNSSQPSDTTPMPEVLRRDTRDIHVGFRCCADP